MKFLSKVAKSAVVAMIMVPIISIRNESLEVVKKWETGVLPSFVCYVVKSDYACMILYLIVFSSEILLKLIRSNASHSLKCFYLD
jgi:hypothetical protein